MTNDRLKTGWKTWRFDQIAINVNDRIDDPSKSDADYYVGLEHLDPESLKIRRWGSPTDVEATKLIFKTGDIILGRRRVYQRKLAVAEFDGICSAHAMVLRPREEVVAREFLPFFMQSDLFMERALAISVGSLSPTINWKTLAKQEFALPPLDEQRRIAEVLWAVEGERRSLFNARNNLKKLKSSAVNASFRSYYHEKRNPESVLPKTASWFTFRDCCSHVKDGTHLSPKFVDDGVPFLLVSNISDGHINWDVKKWITQDTYNELCKNFRPSKGDVLYSLVGSFGIPVHVDWDRPFQFQRHIGILRPRADILIPEYLCYFLESRSGKIQAQRFAEGLAQKTITLGALAEFRIDLPEIAVQQSIVRRISSIDICISLLDEKIKKNKFLGVEMSASALNSQSPEMHNAL